MSLIIFLGPWEHKSWTVESDFVKEECEKQEADKSLGWILGRKMVLSKHQAALPLRDLWLPTAVTSSQAAPQDPWHSGKPSQPFLVLGAQVAANSTIRDPDLLSMCQVALQKLGFVHPKYLVLWRWKGIFHEPHDIMGLHSASCKLTLYRGGTSWTGCLEVGFWWSSLIPFFLKLCCWHFRCVLMASHLMFLNLAL